MKAYKRYYLFLLIVSLTSSFTIANQLKLFHIILDMIINQLMKIIGMTGKLKLLHF